VTVDSIPTATVPDQSVNQRRVDRWRLLNSYAGAVSRLIGYVIDSIVVTGSFAVGAFIFEYVASTVLPVEVDLSDTPIVAGIALGIWAFTYFTYALAATGRTVGKALVGTRVVRADGSDLRAGRAALRVLVTPLSLVLLGIPLLLVVLRADRRALHDLIADTCEIYWWRQP
jgi:uncharacterized RDD family membrane protein YckC